MFGEFWNLFLWILLSAVVFLLFMFFGIRIFGLKPYIISSSSMSPAFNTGDMIYVKETDVSYLNKGDIVTFRFDVISTATHRIYEIDHSKKIIYTCGINNFNWDGSIELDPCPVSFSDIVGVPVFCVPHLGSIYYFITTSPKSYIISLLCICTTIISIVLDKGYLHWRGGEKGEEKQSLRKHKI